MEKLKRLVKQASEKGPQIKADLKWEHSSSKLKKNSKKVCPKCGSNDIVSHTDEDLRKEHKLVMQCFACDNFWKVKW